MMRFFLFRKQPRLLSILALGWPLGGLLLIAGCGEPAQITEYTIPKATEGNTESDAATDRPVIPVREVPADWVDVTPEQPGLPGYKLPPDWVQAPDAPLSIATYKVSKDGRETVLTIIPLPLLTEEGVPPNIDRWRGQAGLPPLAPEDSLKLVSTLMVDGEKNRYIKIAPEDVKPGAKAMLVACIDNAGRTWYFKLFGDAPLTLEEEARFQTVAQSVRF